jgi:hypothetical protein
MSDPPHESASAPSRGERSGERHRAVHLLTLKRLAMAAATAFLAINIWTGAPLLALWVGSQAGDQTVLSMRAVIVVIVVLSVLVVAMAFALTWLSNTYDELVGRPRGERRAPWLRSMRAEAEGHIESRAGVTMLEQIVMISVYLAVIVFLIWLLFFSGSPLPKQ